MLTYGTTISLCCCSSLYVYTLYMCVNQYTLFCVCVWTIFYWGWHKIFSMCVCHQNAIATGASFSSVTSQKHHNPTDGKKTLCWHDIYVPNPVMSTGRRRWRIPWITTSSSHWSCDSRWRGWQCFGFCFFLPPILCALFLPHSPPICLCLCLLHLLASCVSLLPPLFFSCMLFSLSVFKYCFFLSFLIISLYPILASNSKSSYSSFPSSGIPSMHHFWVQWNCG